MLHHSLQGWLAPAVAGLAIFATANDTLAQRTPAERENAQRPEARRGEVQTLTIPSTELLRLSADIPAEVRAGEQFSYRVTVSNQSDSITLHNIKIEQKPASSVSIQSASMQGGQQTAQQQQQQQQQEQQPQEQPQQEQPQEEQPQEEQPQEEQPQEEQPQEQQEQQPQEQQQQEQGQQQDKNRWTINQLAPGESRTIEVQATGNEQGQADTCFMITSYTPALCVTTKVVKPQLELTKNAPEQINICDPLKYEYIVKNPGTGDLAAFVVRDQLPEGVETESGKTDLEFRLDDGLKAGETRQFVANLVVKKTGSFSSPATASAVDGELETRSRAPETRVAQADLAVAVDGQRRVYGRQAMNYTARITNTGNAPAENVLVAINIPRQARLVDVGQMRISNEKVEQRGQQGQPTPAAQSEQEQQQEQQQAEAEAQNASQAEPQAEQGEMRMATEEMRIERLEAGQTVAFDFALRPGGLDEIKTEVVVMQRCAGDEARDATRSVAMATTQVVLLPDLMVSLVDNEGTIPEGSEVTYFLTVRNQGDAPSKNIEATIELPEELELVNVDGPTEAERAERSLNFAPIEQLGPDQQVRWIIVAKAKGEGEIRVNAKVNSDDLERPVSTEEPTVLLAGEGEQQPEAKPQQKPEQEQPEQEQPENEQ